MMLIILSVLIEEVLLTAKQPLLLMPRMAATMMTRIGVTIAVGSSIWKDCRKPKKA
jgi:hypothetical protein